MILRSYGDKLHSVEIRFDSRAFNEVGFRRDRETSFEVEEFERDWERLRGEEIADHGKGRVQDETQARMLETMQAHLERLVAELGEGEVVRIENPDTDWPKLRDTQTKVVEDGENVLHFDAWVDPPLRVGIWKRKSRG